MDPKQFDRLARIVGSGDSRRGLLKKLAGGAFGSLAAAAGFGDAAAAMRKRAPGDSCAINADCASNLCVHEGRTRKICHCVSAANCPHATDICRSAACVAGVCGFSVNLGLACDDGDVCTTGDVCGADGVCAGTPVVCPTPDQCHAQGTCDPRTGLCSNPAKPDGTACDDGNANTCNDVCTAGTCAGSGSVACVVSEWSDWGPCSASCSGGTQTRTRSVITPAFCGGAACPLLSDSQACNTQACVACSDAQWSSNECSNYTFINGGVVCTGGGAINEPPCCASDLDCPSDSPYCVVSYTLALSSHTLETTICPTDPSKGMCSLYGPCSVAP